MMPEMDGFATCLELRKRKILIVMLTALNRPDDIVHGFNLGQMTISPNLLPSVRLRCVYRRSCAASIGARNGGAFVLTANEISLNDDTHEVSVRDEAVHLTPIEYQLLRFLMISPDRPISKDTLFQHVWGHDMVGGTTQKSPCVVCARKLNKIPHSLYTY